MATQTIKFTFEGFEIEARFSKDSEPPFDNWELDKWNLADSNITHLLFSLKPDDSNSLNERIEAACYEALENYDKNDYIDEEH